MAYPDIQPPRGIPTDADATEERPRTRSASDGDTIRYLRPPQPLPFDGERFTTAVSGRIEYEHVHRYLFARQFCVNCTVLDVASGEGYGSAILAQVAERVTGIDIAFETVAHARASYGSPKLSFGCGSCVALPLASASVDTVVSFETLEHIVEHERFFEEAKRVLRTGGMCVISTPDRVVYSEESGYTNPFHARELNRQEFEELVRAHFAHVTLIGQRAGMDSLILPASAPSGPGSIEVFSRSGEMISAYDALPRARYLIAVASDLPLPEVKSGLFVGEQGAGGEIFEEGIVQAVLRAGRPGAAPLSAIFSSSDTLPAAAGRTQIERTGNDVLVLAHDNDPQLVVKIAEPDSPWLLVRAELVAGEKGLAHFFFRTVGQQGFDPRRAVYRPVQPGSNTLHVILAADAAIDMVRFDPTDRPGLVLIRDLSIFSPAP